MDFFKQIREVLGQDFVDRYLPCLQAAGCLVPDQPDALARVGGAIQAAGLAVFGVAGVAIGAAASPAVAFTLSVGGMACATASAASGLAAAIFGRALK